MFTVFKDHSSDVKTIKFGEMKRTLYHTFAQAHEVRPTYHFNELKAPSQPTGMHII